MLKSNYRIALAAIKSHDRRRMDFKSKLLTRFKSRARLETSKVFCMAPWVTLHARPNGEVFPCCLAHSDYPVANLKQQNVKQCWNSEAYKKLRANMLSEQASDICQMCYSQEALGYSHSPRREFNRNFAHHYSRTRDTLRDGHLENMDMAYLDIRYSNVCNFRCRSCGPNWSSKFGPLQKNQGLFDELKPHLQSLETVYFAGGEPLLMTEHYQVLEWLISNNKTKVRLNYSTNFSTLEFRDWNILELWKHFEHVTVVASLDGSGKKGEYIRPGLDWNQVLRNREEMKKSCAHVDFYVNCTLSALNAFHVVDFHKELVEIGFIESKERLLLNPLLEPYYLRPDIFPFEMKQSLAVLYSDHMENYNTDWQFTDSTGRNDWWGAHNLIQEKDNSQFLPKLRDKIIEMDQTGHGKFYELFPELHNLLH